MDRGEVPGELALGRKKNQFDEELGCSRPPLEPARVRAVLRAHVRAAIDALAAADRPSDRAVHEARKRLKRARASLRLLRPLVGDETYRRENLTLRDAARPLSQVRDAAVMEEALAAMLQGTPAAASLVSLQEAFRERGEEVRRIGLDRMSVRRMVEAMEGADARIALWQIDELRGPARVCDALQRLYRKGRKALARAHSRGSPEALHEARKQVKYLELALEPFRPQVEEGNGEDRISRIVDRAEAIEEHLGDDHDLWVLRAQMAGLLDAAPAEAERIIAAIAARQKELREKALAQGRALYRKKPRRFRAGLEREASERSE